MQPSTSTDLISQLAEMGERLSEIPVSTFLLMVIAILIGVLFILWSMFKSQSNQLKAVLDTNAAVIKQAEERHNNDLKRIEERLEKSEDRAKKADERSAKKDEELKNYQDAHLKIVREYEGRIVKIGREVEKAIQTVKRQQLDFELALTEKDKTISSLRDDKKSLQMELADLGDENSDLKDKIEKSEDLATEMKIKYEKMLEGVNKTISEKDNQIEKLENQVSMLKQEIEKLKGIIHDSLERDRREAESKTTSEQDGDRSDHLGSGNYVDGGSDRTGSSSQ